MKGATMSAMPNAKDFSDRLPTGPEQDNARQLQGIMRALVHDDAPAKVGLALQGGQSAHVSLMPAIARTFIDVLDLIASGHGFQLIPVEAQLTTQQAADILNVSRPYLIKLLEDGQMPYEMVGRHRRIRADDVFAYKARRDRERADALSELAERDARLGLL